MSSVLIAYIIHDFIDKTQLLVLIYMITFLMNLV